MAKKALGSEIIAFTNPLKAKGTTAGQKITPTKMKTHRNRSRALIRERSFSIRRNSTN